ncbi:MAG: cytidine deaminase [Planctomycetota bacterium]|jgi:cytidine deaminase
MQHQDLIQAALQVRERAYAPYSKFQVGAAVVTTDGELFLGTNMENASFGLTVCAERNAIAAAIASGARGLAQVAVVSGPGAQMCGACRQVLAEFADDQTEVLLGNGAGEFRELRLKDLLPEAFTPADLP